MAASTSGESVTGTSVTSGSNFVRESIEELKKVSAPTRAETMQATVVTIVIIVILSICLSIMDAAFNWLMARILG